MNTVDKINNLAKSTDVDINMLRIAFALERMVARISSSSLLSKKLIIKGGFLLYKTLDSERFTRDLDALGKNISPEKIKVEIPKTIQSDLNDGISYLHVKTEDLKHKDKYEGLRFIFQFGIGDKNNRLKNRSSRIQLDIGFSDLISKKLSPAC